MPASASGHVAKLLLRENAKQKNQLCADILTELGSCITAWLGGWVVRALDMQPARHRSDSRPHSALGQQPWTSRSPTGAPVAKQYNLVPAKGRWCSTAEKVSLASHWPRVTDNSCISIYGLTSHDLRMKDKPGINLTCLQAQPCLVAQIPCSSI